MARQVTETKTQLPAAGDGVEDMMREASGAGISFRREDNIVPQLSVLQPQSPEVMEGPGKMEGARPGDFLLGDRLIKGTDGVLFQPCAVEHKLFEFMPLETGGGFVAEHPVKRDGFGREELMPNGTPVPPAGVRVDKYDMKFSNGNHLLHYRHWSGLVWEPGAAVGKAYVLPFKSTGHTTSREWMFKAMTANQFPDGKSRPLFGHLYRLTTSHRRNSKGQWYEVVVGQPICLSPAVNPGVSDVVADCQSAFVQGRELAKAIASGERETAAPVANAAPPSDDAEVPF